VLDVNTGLRRRNMLDLLKVLHEMEFAATGDAELNTRIAQYEMAFRMQTSVPDVTDLKSEPASTFDLYGPDSHTTGTFAANCLLARRLAERGVRFIQLYHQGWDHHGGLPNGIRAQTAKTDQASAALVLDLKQRGMLDDTLVVWGGEFGRTSYSQGTLPPPTTAATTTPCCCCWGGIKPWLHLRLHRRLRLQHRQRQRQTPKTNQRRTPPAQSIPDLQAILHLLGVDHTQLTYKYQGRYYRLTGVGHVVRDILA
jgi:hypothetical protein